MWKPWRNVEGPAKVLVVFVTMLLVATGLCGVQWFLFAIGGRDLGAFMTVIFVLGYLELAVMAISLAGAVITLLWMGIRGLIWPGRDWSSEDRSAKDEIQRLFPRDHDDS